MANTAYKYCPRCGDEYQAWAARCVDCGVPLGDECPPSVEEVDGAHDVVTLDVGHLGTDERDILQMVLRGEGVAHEFVGPTLIVPQARMDVVNEAMTSIEPGTAEMSESARPRPRPFALSAEVAGYRVASRRQRFLGRVVDGLLWGIPSGLALRSGAAWVGAISTAANAVYQIALTAQYGCTLGKLCVGSRVIRVDGGGRPGWNRSARRWIVPLGVVTGMPYIPPIVRLPTSLWALVVFGSILWDPLGRGWHDRVAGTVVIDHRARSRAGRAQ